MRLIYLLIASVLFAACSPDNSNVEKSALYFGGPILTMEGLEPAYVEAVVTQADRIVFTGAEQTAREIYGASATQIDLNGATMLPGLIDPHVHYTADAKLHNMHRVPEPWKLRDETAFLERLKTIAADTPEGEWIILWGYDKALIPPNRNLTKDDLDRISTHHPIYVLYLGMHWASVNTRAMDILDISEETPTTIPGGGIFFKDSEGKPTGLLTESAVYGIMPILNELVSPDQLRENYYAVAKQYNANGITTIADLASGVDGGLSELLSLQEMANDPAFSVRLVTTPIYQILPQLEGPINWDGNFQANRIKLLIDASLVGGTAATIEPNLAGDTGNLNYTQEAYTQAISEAMTKGFSVTTHTMGDRAHQVLLNSFESLENQFPSGEFRHGIEHSAFIQDAEIARIANMEFSVSTMPALIHVYGDSLRDTLYGPSMTKDIFPNDKFLESGINLAIHSDSPIISAKPLFSVWSAVMRQTYNGNIVGPDHAISAYNALKAATLGAAYHLELENEIGSIKVGKLADFVILSENPLTTTPDHIKSINIQKTIKGGRIVYSD